jgi:serine/threonine-protein kinase RsbW
VKPVAPPQVIDLVGDHEVVRHRVERRVHAEGFSLKAHRRPQDLLDSLFGEDSEHERWIVLLQPLSEEWPEDFLRSVCRDRGRTRVVVFAPGLDEARARTLVLDGASAVYGLPLPVSPVREWFALDSYLQTVYPGALDCERTEIHRLRLPSIRKWVAPTIRHLCSRLDRLGHSDDLVRSVFPLVIDEAVTNAMQHGNGWNPERTVTIEATLSPGGFRLVVEDEGAGFDRAGVRDPLRRENLTREGGRGLFLMETLIDEVRYEEGGRRVILCGGSFASGSVPVG